MIDINKIKYGRITLAISDNYEILPPKLLYEFTIYYNKKNNTVYATLIKENGNKLVKLLNGHIFGQILDQIKPLLKLQNNKQRDMYYGNPVEIYLQLENNSHKYWGNGRELGASIIQNCHPSHFITTKNYKKSQEIYDFNTGLLISFMKNIFN
jgi:hypothetical protein